MKTLIKKETEKAYNIRRELNPCEKENISVKYDRELNHKINELRENRPQKGNSINDLLSSF